MQQHDYDDARGNHRTRLEKNVSVFVHFWDFTIWNGNLQELAFIKSSLQYFMQCFWKRTNKEGSKIEFAKELHHEGFPFGHQSLFFVARQKNKKHFLHVFLSQEGNSVREIYLEGQEVIMLDIAIGKAISLLTPSSVCQT